jgi:hypothetical protein
MKTRVFGMMSLVLLASASIASAQSFTYVSTSSAPSTNVGGMGPDGRPFGAAAWSGTSELMMDGKKLSSNFTCVAMTQPNNAKVFDQHMICNGSDAGGTWTSVWGCSGAQPTGMSCWGQLQGLTGGYAKRTGVITGSGKGAMQMGAGQWNP